MTLETAAARTGEDAKAPRLQKLASEPLTLSSLADLATAEERVATIRRRIEACQAEAEDLNPQEREARERAMQKYLERMETRYSVFDWKKALAGARILYPVTLEGIVQVGLSLPTGKVASDVQAYVDANQSSVTIAEALLLRWVATIRLLAASNAPEQDLRALPVEVRLKNFRDLTEMIVTKLANSIQSFQAWVNTKMELELGNS